MTTTRRTVLLGAAAGALAASAPLQAQQRRSLKDPIRLGFDPALEQSGFVRALLRAFLADTGVAVLPTVLPSATLLESLERGELDAAIANAPAAERALFDQGLIHDRRPLGVGSFVIVGPATRGQDPASIARRTDAVQALTALHAAAQADPAAVRWVSAGDGSGAHLAEQALWRSARLAPGPAWTLAPRDGEALIEAARREKAYALVERGAWLARAGTPLALLVEDDARMAAPVHVMRSFRSPHPGAKLLLDWIAGPRGRRVVAGLRGYRVAGDGTS